MATVNIMRGIESGTILNEHYTFQEYVNRRGGWLGVHPSFARMPTGLFAIARRNATEVFGTDSTLSIQEVRRRELAHDVDPLLPLPTTDNTATLDNFRSYPGREWSPNLVWQPPPTDDNEDEDDPLLRQEADANDQDVNLVSLSQVAGASQVESAPQLGAGDSTTNPDIVAPPPAIDPRSQSIFNPIASGSGSLNAPNPVLQTLKKRPSKSANKNRNMLSGQQTHARDSASSTQHRMSDQTSHFPTSSSPMPDETSTRATTPEGNNERPELVRDIISALGTPSPGAPAPPARLANVGHDIGALAGRGIHVPVKQKRGTKRAASESPAATDSVIGSQVSEQNSERPAKKLKLKGPRDPTMSPREDSGSDFVQPARKKQKKKSSPKKQKARAPRETDDDEIEAVVAGTALPKTKAEAKRASKLRHDRLLAEHRAAQSAKAGSRKQPRNTGPDPDMMPEFFNPANFSPGEEMDTVRCICGVTYDDNGNMLSCDECNVWQHNGCMGEAVPKDVRRGKYLCQVCDPWAHRVLLSELRREEGGE